MGDNSANMLMFVGYSDCESDSVQMWDMQTKRVVVTHDVI